MKKRFLHLFSFFVVLSLATACGDPAENMNNTIADFSEKCVEDSYDCDCWKKKVKAYFKTDEAYVKYWKTHKIMPKELNKQLGECSKDEDFDF